MNTEPHPLTSLKKLNGEFVTGIGSSSVGRNKRHAMHAHHWLRKQYDPAYVAHIEGNARRQREKRQRPHEQS